MKRLSSFFLLTICVGSALAASRSASQYYRDAASAYIAGQNASAAQTCEEGLREHPGDSRLQKLLERIRDNQEQQKKQCQNPQDSDSSQNKDKDKKQNQDQKNQQDRKDQNGSGSSAAQGSSNSQGNSNSQGKGGEQGQSSNSQGSSDSQKRPNPQNQSGTGASGSSTSGNGMSEQAMPVRPGELNREQAQQLLKDFNQNSGERKAWRPVHGQSAPEKDW